jgi:hypothetical protein
MTDTEAYKLVLKQRQCFTIQRVYNGCNKDCDHCLYSCNPCEMLECLTYLIGILKARCPELYFVDDIEMLKEAIHNETERKETKK